jgi:hypothetical protein
LFVCFCVLLFLFCCVVCCVCCCLCFWYLFVLLHRHAWIYEPRLHDPAYMKPRLQDQNYLWINNPLTLHDGPVLRIHNVCCLNTIVVIFVLMLLFELWHYYFVSIVFNYSSIMTLLLLLVFNYSSIISISIQLFVNYDITKNQIKMVVTKTVGVACP